MNKQKQLNSIEKMIVISPEAYNNFKKSILVPSNRQLLDIEQNFLKILQDENLTTSQRLTFYNNLILTSLNKNIIKLKNRPNDSEKKTLELPLKKELKI